MGTKTIEFRFEVGGTLTNVTSVVLRDPSNVYGVRRADTFAVVVPAGTALARTATGVYRYTFTEPAPGLNYTYWLEWVYLGNTRRQEGTLQTAPVAVGGAIPVPPSDYVTMGVSTVACGDEDLETFLNVHAAVVWAMQLRRGVTVDLRYQYFILGLLDLALDHVRMLIDTEIASQQSQETGYNNSSNISDSEMEASHTRTSSSTSSSSALQSSTRSALRTTSSTMEATAEQTSLRNGNGSDASTQEQNTDSNRTAVNDSLTTTTPALHSTNRQYKNSHMESTSDSYTQETITHYNLTVPFAGSISGQSGTRTTPQPQNESTNLLQGSDSAEGHSVRSNTVVGDGLAVDDATTEGDGTRVNSITREMISTMTGTAVTTSSSAMSSTAHAESHRSSTMTAHAESSSHSEMAASGSSSREGQGASSAVSAQNYTKNYYDQIFESLKQLRENTVAQIKRLEQQVSLTTRVVISRLATRTPQNALTAGNIYGNSYLAGNPYGTFPLTRTVR